MTNTGLVLRKLRQDANLTQKNVGEMIGIDRPTICLHEKARFPTRRVLLKYEQAFDVEFIFVAVKKDDLVLLVSKDGKKEVLYQRKLL